MASGLEDVSRWGPSALPCHVHFPLGVTVHHTISTQLWLSQAQLLEWARTEQRMVCGGQDANAAPLGAANP